MNLRRTVAVFFCVMVWVPSSWAVDCEGVPTVAGEDITLQQVTRASSPVDLQAPPGDTDRIFVVEQNGRIRVVRLADDSLVSRPFLDIASRLSSGGERGLLGLAFHPDYQENGLFYVNYTARSGGVTTIARYQVSGDDPDVADPASETVLLRISQPFSNHNAGQIVFGPLDGYLYVSTGDGGSGGDPGNRAQNRANLLGKMLRIDVDGGDPFAIPQDNPMLSGSRDEVWALGLRNPWRFDFDPETGDLYIADVGQNAWEEIDFLPAEAGGGKNFEWKVQEGLHRFSGTAFGPGDRVGPIHEYRHGGGGESGCSITGGVVYRGCRMPDLHGVYFYAEFCNNWIRTLRVVNGQATDIRDRTAELNAGIAGTVQRISTFGRDGRGEVYVVEHGGRIHRVVSTVRNPPTARIVTDPAPAEVELRGGTAQVILDGSSSDDGDDDSQELAYAWEKVSGPDGDEIARPAKESTGITFSLPGDYVYQLTVTDPDGSDEASATVTVKEETFLFRRGDTNADGEIDISDGIGILNHLFLGGAKPICLDAADVNDDEKVQLSDAIQTFQYLFLGGVEPADPGPEVCGPDPAGDELACASQPRCL